MKRKVEISSFFALKNPKVMEDCICCMRKIDAATMEEHLKLCIDSTLQKKLTSSPKRLSLSQATEHCQASAFQLLMEASAKQTVPVLHFRLDIIDGKLMPLFLFSNELSTVCSSIYCNEWTAEINIKSCRLYCMNRDSKDSSNLENVKLKISSNVKSIAATDASHSFAALQKDDSKYYITTLKSLLQKAIRRKCIDNTAIRLAYALHNISLNELLRRLPIVCLEDCLLHPNFPSIVWLMMAVSKGYNPPDGILALVFTFIEDLTACEWKDVIPDDSAMGDVDANTNNDDNDVDTVINGTSSFDNNDESDNSVSSHLRKLKVGSVRTILASMLLRSSFGGMTGDLYMIHALVDSWYQRFVSQEDLVKDPNASTADSDNIDDNNVNTPLSYLHSTYICELRGCKWGNLLLQSYLSMSQPVDEWIVPAIKASFAGIYSYYIDWSKISTLIKEDVIIEGIDFHCDKGLVPYLLFCIEDNVDDFVADGEFLEEKVKASIWYFRSSSNMHKLWFPISSSPLLPSPLSPSPLSPSPLSSSPSLLTFNDKLYDVHQKNVKDLLTKKRELCALWSRISAYTLKYTTLKREEFFNKYTKLISK